MDDPIIVARLRPLGMKSSPSATQGQGDSKSRARPAVVIGKVGPWSVFRFSLLFYLSVMVVILLGLATLYAILGATGALAHVTGIARNLLANQSFSIHGGWILARLTLLSLSMVLTWSLINLLIAFLYNLIADIIGGIGVMFAPARRPLARAVAATGGGGSRHDLSRYRLSRLRVRILHPRAGP